MSGRDVRAIQGEPGQDREAAMQSSANPVPDRRGHRPGLASRWARVVEKDWRGLGERLLGWEICRNLVCADRVRHEIRESTFQREQH